MAGYRRFIAYVYDYENGKKGSNCGFIKVEVKDQQCSVEVHLHCPGLPEDVGCRIYGFTRKDGLINGILLDTCETEKEIVECMIVTDAMDMNASGISMGKMGGMVITTDIGGFFGTEWDDQPIRPENFREVKITPIDTASEAVPVTDNPDIDPEDVSPSDIASSSVTAAMQEMSLPEPGEIPEMSPETAQPDISDTFTGIADSDSAKDSEAIESSDNNMPEKQNMPEKHMEPTSSPVNQKAPDEFSPFSDGELTAAWKIHLNDLKRFPRHYCALRNNRFIQYGHYNFGHLLLGQRNNGQYILGVPGGYNQQERFMANMFGFPYFKESRYVELPKARGGYWYRLIDAPDSHR